MNKQEKILRFLQLMYSEGYLKNQIQKIELSFKLMGGMKPSEEILFNKLKEDSSNMLNLLHQKYLQVYDRFYSENQIDVLYEFYSSETYKYDTEVQKRLGLELSSAEIAWLDEIIPKDLSSTIAHNSQILN